MPLGIFGVVFVVLLVLKLAGVIGISWWLVTMPLWIGIAIFVVSMFTLAVLDRPVKRK